MIFTDLQDPLKLMECVCSVTSASFQPPPTQPTGSHGLIWAEFLRHFVLDPVSESLSQNQRPGGLPWWRVRPGKHLKSLGSINSSWLLAFLILSVHAEEVFLYSTSVLSLLPSRVYFSLCKFTSSVFTKFVSQHIYLFLCFLGHCSCAWRQSFTSCQLSWAPLSFRTNSHRISLHLSNPKLFSWRGCSLQFIFVTPLRTLNVTISWLLHPTWPLIIMSPNIPLLVMSTRYSWVSSWTRWPV